MFLSLFTSLWAAFAPLTEIAFSREKARENSKSVFDVLQELVYLCHSVR